MMLVTSIHSTKSAALAAARRLAHAGATIERRDTYKGRRYCVVCPSLAAQGGR